MLKPVELEIELFCRGMVIGDSCRTNDGRRISRTRAGLGSGLEIVIPARPKDIWVNVPVVEPFAQRSVFTLQKGDDGYFVLDGRDGAEYPVRIPEEPAWYSRRTTSGVEMSRVGVLQGNYLAVYVSNRCLYWTWSPSVACKFCTTGKNVGTAEESRKNWRDVVEVAQAARDESGSIFTHFNTGYHYEDRPDREVIHGLRQCEVFVRAVRENVGGFIGIQAVPVPRAQFQEYDDLIEAGTDHFSFCYEFEDPEVFARICPGKAQTVGQHAFFEAMEYTAKKLGRGRVSGEIIAGVESIEATKRGIDRIVSAGAFPTVCIFRPTVGSDMENDPPPDPEAMKEVFAYVHESCRRARLPVGILPIEVSLVVQPEEAAGLIEPTLQDHIYAATNWSLRQLARPYIAYKKRPAA
ncbi:MAG TPA: radical SAM protein [Thermoanaerobaculia bacterium]|jgi:sodium-dependent dicarboxylate transporter 2/3/5|nr:radical SAM protein [Thermoanaerobaculia bacterium]